ncbi:MAG: hypothetical protein R2753_12125 [Chitinophagales bacterium]
MKEEFNEYLRAGEELTETINEVIKDIETLEESIKTLKLSQHYNTKNILI